MTATAGVGAEAERMGMDSKVLLEAIGGTLRKLPDVFSTPQWGGRAYKLPGPGGSTKKPKLLAFVAPTKAGDAVSVSFKLGKERAEESVGRYGWIVPHSFGSLGRAGWVEALVTSRRQVATLERLLAESRTQYRVPGREAKEPSASTRRRGRGRDEAPSTDPVARRIDRVMTEMRPEGWEPDAGGEFERRKGRRG